MKILLTNEVAIKLKYYTHFAPGEVSGMAKTSINGDGDIVVVDIELFEQECTGGTTDIDDASMAKFMHLMSQRGESLKSWNLWWHTHANMNVFWSGTDTGTINAHKDAYDFLVSVVTNKKGEFLGRIDTFPKDLSPAAIDIPAKHEDLEVEIYMDTDQVEAVDAQTAGLEEEMASLLEMVDEYQKQIDVLNDSLLEDEDVSVACQAEVIEKVRQKTFVQTSNNGYRGGEGCTHRVWGPTKPSKKKESYYERNEGEQEKFEVALDDIRFSYPVTEEPYNGELESEEYDYMTPCPECQNPIIHCMCPDALEKYGDVIKDSGVYYDGFESFDDWEDETTQDYKRIMREEGFCSMQGALFPIRHNGK